MRKRPVAIDPDTMGIIAAFTTMGLGNLIAVLHRRGIMDDAAVDEVIDLMRAGDDFSPTNAVISDVLAKALQRRIRGTDS